MVSTLKVILTALSLQLLIGIALTMSVAPNQVPTEQLNIIKGHSDDLIDESMKQETREKYKTVTATVIDTGEEGLRGQSLIGFMTRSLWNGISIPWATDALNDNIITKLIKYAIILYQMIIAGYFLMEIFFVVFSKKPGQ